MTTITQTPVAARAAAGVSLSELPIVRRDQAFLFLNSLHGKGLTELRILDGRMRSEFHDPTPSERAYALAPSADVYAGVLPRNSKTGGGGKANCPTHTRWLWCDCDSQMAVERLLSMTSRPHMIVESSPGRAHAYWMLDEPLSVEWMERANKRLAFSLGGDLRATDTARILRVPGTRNHKRDHWVPCFLSAWDPGASGDGSGYRIRNLVGRLPDPEPPKVKAKPTMKVRPVDPRVDALQSVRSHQYVHALTGRDVTVDGMVRCPFHKDGQERTPSMSVGGPHDTCWYCFGCAEGGDIFSFAGRLWNLDPRKEFPVIKDRLLGVFQ